MPRPVLPAVWRLSVPETRDEAAETIDEARYPEPDILSEDETDWQTEAHAP